MAEVRLTNIEQSKKESKSNVGCVVEWFLQKEPMSHKKIQKLAYYAHAWSLTLDHVEIVPNISFEAWVHGPVNTQIWHRCKRFGWRNMEIDPKQFDESITKVDKVLSKRQKKILNLVWETYGGYSADELEAMTHAEDPWKNARSGLSKYDRTKADISNESIIEYYMNHFSYE